MAKRRAPKKRALKKVRPLPLKVRVNVRREEFDRVVGLLNQHGEALNALRHDLDIQFKRMAQIQSELDEMQRVVLRLVGQAKS